MRKAEKGNTKANAKTEHKPKGRRENVVDVMITIFTTLTIISGAILSFLGISGGLKSHRSLGLWILYVTIVFALTWAFLSVQKKFFDSEAVGAKPEIHITAETMNSLKQNQPTQRLVTNIKFTNTGDVTTKSLTGEYETSLNTKPDISQPITRGDAFGPLEIPKNNGARILRITSLPMGEDVVKAVKDQKVWLFLRVRAKFDGFGGDEVPDLCAIYREDVLGNGVWGNCSDLPRILQASTSPQPPPVRIGEATPPHVGVSIESVDMRPNEKIVFHLKFINAGDTPAINLRIPYQIVLAPSAFDPRGSMPLAGGVMGPTEVLPHKGREWLVWSRIFTEDEIKAVIDGKNFVYFWGEGTYEGLGKSYPVEFCTSYNAEFKIWGECPRAEKKK